MMELNDRILLNMAINNVENKIKEEIKVKEFKERVIQRYKIYKEIHTEVVKND